MFGAKVGGCTGRAKHGDTSTAARPSYLKTVDNTDLSLMFSQLFRSDDNRYFAADMTERPLVNITP